MATIAYLVILCAFVMNHAVNGIGLNGNCTTATDCDSSLICENSTCISDIIVNESYNDSMDCMNGSLCNTTSLPPGSSICPAGTYKLNATVCEDRKIFGESCNISMECVSLFCNISGQAPGTCDCPEGYFRLNDTTCDKRKIFGESCNISMECVSLFCNISGQTPGTCDCPEGYYRLNDTTCDERKIFGESCNNSMECVSLFCNISGQTPGTCDCPEGYYTLNDTTCDERKIFGESCNISMECVSLFCNISGQTPGTCNCPEGYFRLNGTTCDEKKGHGSDCNGEDECTSAFVCSNTKCRCQTGKRFAQSTCRSSDDFKVSVTGATVETNSASLTWTSNSYGLSVTYDISVNQPEILPQTASAQGGSLPGLTPGTLYTVTITSTVALDSIYQEIRAETTYSFTTDQVHGGDCSAANCATAWSCENNICRCPNGGRFSNDVCYAPDDFKVSVTGATVETNSASLTWTSNSYSLSVTYDISVNPPDIPSKTVSAQDGSLSGLTPGKQYTVTITSTVAAYSIYEKITAETTYSFTTEQVHGGDCSAANCTTPLSCENSICRCPNGGRFSTGNCYSPDDFKVSVTGATVETNSASLTWTSNSYSLSVTYDISVNPPDIPSKTVSAQDGSLSGLTPGKQYTVTITSTVAAYSIYEKITAETTYSFTTDQVHGGDCSAAKCASPFSCENSICRCPNGGRFSTGNCYSPDNFKVSVTKIAVQTTSATLTWTSDDYGLSLTYDISVNPPDIPSETASAQGGSLSGLTPGKQYSVTITSTVASDSTYQEIKATTEDSFTTEQVHGGNCSPAKCASPLSCENGRCRCPSGERFSSGNCYPLGQFKVNVTSTRVTTMSVTLEWNANKYGLNVNYNILVTQQLSARTSANEQGGSVQDLTPGAQYTLTIISTIPADGLYSQETASETLTVWMIPSEPVSNGEAAKVINNTYTFNFDGSVGQVANYIVVIDGLPGFPKTTNQTEIPGLTLTPAQRYSYTIKAVNGLGNESVPSQGNFIVGAERPGKVSALSTTGITESSLEVAWKKPDEPNGDLIGYLVTYFIKGLPGNCMEINITCSDCDDTWPPYDSTCAMHSELERSKNVFNNTVNSVYQNITGLRAFTSYTIQVQAVNRAGYGALDSITGMTNIAAAKVPASIGAQKTGSNTTAGLSITWTPGEKTGPTTYKIVIREEASINSGQYNDYDSRTLEGYDNTTLNVDGLLAYWNYQVSVTANTSVGSDSEPKTEIFRTQSNIPGVVTGFSVDLDSVDAQKFTISFGCPSEKQRNGKLHKYIVQVMGGTLSDEKVIPHDETCVFHTENFIAQPLTVGVPYTFKVKVENEAYNGTYNLGIQKTIQPKAPILTSVGAPLTVGPQASPLEENSVKMTVCSKCLLDSSQGVITFVGLLVCVSFDNKPCGALPTSQAATKSYSQSKENNFKDPYTATPQLWTSTLSRDVASGKNTSYVIGIEQNCPSVPPASCNGPLPDGAEVKIFVISCTEAGCATFQHATSYRTADASDDVPVGAIVGGIFGVIIIIAIIVVAFIYWRRRGFPRAKPTEAHIQIPEPIVRRERPVSVRNFASELARYHKDANLLFQDDFEDIKKLSDLKHSSDHAKVEDNRVKNRYVNILPYDHSRVKLSTQPEDQESMDFINANYIPGFNSVREYIATQGPMYSTIPDFWRMMWEQDSRVIVMLSDLQEAGKRKVDLYWPQNLHEPINYGNIVVEMTHFSQLNKYTIRNFTMFWGENEPRRVTHFFLAGWLDFSANLKFSDVIEFAKLVRQEARPVSHGPITVHCSAGVGRTGTFIALDYFLQHIDKYGLEGQIDIFAYVMRMRYNRPAMVQAETQYIFIYDALNEYIKKKIDEENSNEYVNFSKNEEKPPEPEESVYMNTNGQSALNMQGYDNQGFEDTESKPQTPTTIL